MKHLYVSTPVNTFHKNDKWHFLVFYCNDAVTQQINTCTQQMLMCRYNHVYLHGIFAYENINVMTFKCIFGHYVNKRFVERITVIGPAQCTFLVAVGDKISYPRCSGYL